MSLTLATLIPGLFLLVLGAALASGRSTVSASLKNLPRSATAAYVFFGGGALWFLWHVWHLSPADFGEYRALLTIAFALIAGLSFKYVPDFLAVRGLAILMLLTASVLLDATYMVYGRVLFMKAAVYVGIALALYLGASPYRLRDFFGWLFQQPGRAKGLGLGLAAYGVLLTVIAFTY